MHKAARICIPIAAAVSAVMVLAGAETGEPERTERIINQDPIAVPVVQTAEADKQEDPVVPEVQEEQQEPTEQPEETEPTEQELLDAGVLRDDIALDYELQLVTQDAADEFGVPYELVLAVMQRESGFQADAHNSRCYGLMQISKGNFDWLCETLVNYGVDDIQGDPRDNIVAGVYMLSLLTNKYDTLDKALMAYNCGEGGAKKLWKQGYTSSKYSRSVLEAMESFCQ